MAQAPNGGAIIALFRYYRNAVSLAGVQVVSLNNPIFGVLKRQALAGHDKGQIKRG